MGRLMEGAKDPGRAAVDEEEEEEEEEGHLLLTITPTITPT